MKKSLFISLLVLTIMGCDIQRFISKPSSRDPEQDFLLFLLVQREDPNYDLFYYEPNPFPGLGEMRQDAIRFRVPGTVPNRRKKSIIFIHGWNFKERNSDPPADFAYKVASIQDTWSSAIQGIDNSNDPWKNEYDFYFFTYRTSHFIESNGRRLFAEIQRSIPKSNQLVLVGHSMGGLVARDAMKRSQESSIHSDEESRWIDGMVTLGTPFFGSPFAVRDYKRSQLSFLQEAISFYTETDGGRDLKHSNQLFGGEKISGGENPYLEELSQPNPNIDNRTIVYAGNLTDCNQADLILFRTSCTILKQDPQFSDSDAIVPKRSALLGGRGREEFEKTGFDHSMISFRSVDAKMGEDFFVEVMQKLTTTDW